jgi:hypothetical protein
LIVCGGLRSLARRYPALARHLRDVADELRGLEPLSDRAAEIAGVLRATLGLTDLQAADLLTSGRGHIKFEEIPDRASPGYGMAASGQCTTDTTSGASAADVAPEPIGR